MLRRLESFSLRFSITLLAVSIVVVACEVAPTVLPTPTSTPLPTQTAVPTATPLPPSVEPEFRQIEGTTWEAVTEPDYQSLISLSVFTVSAPDSAALFLRCFAGIRETEVEILWLGVAGTADYHDEMKYGFGDFPEPGPVSPTKNERWKFESFEPEGGAPVLAAFSANPGALVEEMILWDWMRVALYDKGREVLDGATFDLRGLSDAFVESRWGCG